MEEIEKSHKCEDCNYVTQYKSNLEKHKKTGKHLSGLRKVRKDKKESVWWNFVCCVAESCIGFFFYWKEKIQNRTRSGCLEFCLRSAFSGDFFIGRPRPEKNFCRAVRIGVLLAAMVVPWKMYRNSRDMPTD